MRTLLEDSSLPLHQFHKNGQLNRFSSPVRPAAKITLNDLPLEIIQNHILPHLSLVDLARFASTSRLNLAHAQKIRPDIIRFIGYAQKLPNLDQRKNDALSQTLEISADEQHPLRPHAGRLLRLYSKHPDKLSIISTDTMNDLLRFCSTASAKDLEDTYKKMTKDVQAISSIIPANRKFEYINFIGQRIQEQQQARQWARIKAAAANPAFRY